MDDGRKSECALAVLGRVSEDLTSSFFLFFDVKGHLLRSVHGGRLPMSVVDPGTAEVIQVNAA